MEDTQATHAGRRQQVERMNLIVCLFGRCWAWRGDGASFWWEGESAKLDNKTESVHWRWTVHWQNNQLAAEEGRGYTEETPPVSPWKYDKWAV